MSVYQLLSEVAEKAPAAPALLASGRSTLSYEDLHTHLDATCQALNGYGIRRNDRVAVVLPNGPEMAVAFLSIASAATCAPLNPAYPASAYDFYLSDLDANVLILPAGMDSPARDVAAARGIPVLDLTPRTGDAAGLFTLAGTEAGIPAQSGTDTDEDVALILHTSGTTSRPKMVPLTHANLCASARHIRKALALTPADRCLNVMPLFHIHGLMAALLASLSAGASVICTPGFYAPEFFGWMAALRPTWYTAVPTMHQAILVRAADNAAIIAQHPLRFLRSSSASLPPTVMEDLEQTFGAPVIEAYGMTEAAHQMASNPLPPHPRKPGSVGPASGPKVAIMDAGGTLLPPGTTGEVVIQGPNVTQGYVANPEANAAAFTDGWFRTGDEGQVDEDGYLFLTGRLKEIINRGGEKISPREVDEVLLDHPAVAQVVAFAVPDVRLGEDIAAAVVQQPGMEVSARALRDYVATRLAPYKVPSQIVFLDAIPKGPTGKLQRIGLAERLGVASQDVAEPTQPFTAPRTAVEKFLADVWMNVLGLNRISVHDRFLSLGGDSILATRLVARIRDQIQLELTLLDFFDAPTIAEQAVILENKLLADEPTSAPES